MAVTQDRPKIAVVHSILVPGGGTEAVTAWTVDALKQQYAVSLITFSQLDMKELDGFYGTDLASGGFSIVKPSLPPLIGRTRRFAALKDHLMMRYCAKATREFDLIAGVGPMDFGTKGIQYVGLSPASSSLKVLGKDPQLGFGKFLLKRTALHFWGAISGFSQNRCKQNISLMTSKWVGEACAKIYGIDEYRVVSPPVNTPTAIQPWEGRTRDFLCVARIVPAKKLLEVVEIVQRLHRVGREVSLTIVGRPDDPGYYRALRRLCRANASWLALQDPMPKKQLFDLMGEHRYGINGAVDEPFGIAVAEMVKAGCIVFVPDGGGQTEIVADSRLIYRDPDDAVDKISLVLDSGPLQQDLLRRMSSQGRMFSTESFCREIQETVAQFFNRAAVAA